MKQGKRICNALKEVRMQVAKANDIKYAPTECHHKGDCAGTCPKCEAEVRWIEQQLQLRRQLGKAVAVVGVSMGLAALTACDGKTAPPDSGSDSLSIQAQTLGFVDTIPDSMLTISQASQPNETNQNDEHGTPPVVSQGVEPENLVPIVGEAADSIIFVDYEQQASFPGGQEALLDFLDQNVRYPDGYDGCAQGRVVVSFTIDFDGSIVDPKVIRSVDKELDAEALRVVGLMPKWRPAKENGKCKRTNYILPILIKTK